MCLLLFSSHLLLNSWIMHERNRNDQKDRNGTVQKMRFVYLAILPSWWLCRLRCFSPVSSVLFRLCTPCGFSYSHVFLHSFLLYKIPPGKWGICFSFVGWWLSIAETEIVDCSSFVLGCTNAVFLRTKFPWNNLLFSRWISPWEFHVNV